MSKIDEILHSKFDVEVHSKNFINYCEVIVLPDGSVEYAVPSHERKVIEIFKREFDLSDEDFDNFPEELSIDYICKKCHLIMLWYDYAYAPIRITKEQRNTLHNLVSHKCISERIWTFIYQPKVGYINI